MVLPNKNSLSAKLPRLKKKNNQLIRLADVAEARQYIADYWTNLIRTNTQDDDTLIGLPYPYLIPSYEEGMEFDYNELYYWDSYFMVQCLLDEQHKELVVGILEDLLSIFERYKIIPNGNRTYLMGRSQPPFLTSFILDVYKAFNMDKKWLRRAIDIAHEEYSTVWMGTTKPNARLVYDGLSRYYDINYQHDLAEAESGWDLTTRFGRKCMNYLPVDLNSLLFKYEKDFAYAERILGDEEQAVIWEQAAHKRRTTVNDLMWSDMRGLFYDYNYHKEHRGSVASLAAYYPMWAGLASEEQAAKLVNNLKKFDERGGLATTDQQLGQMVPGSIPTQWAYPNGWAPLHFIVVKGLERYGYKDEARAVAQKWLRTNLEWFNIHHNFLEKYNVVQPTKPPSKGVYPSQTGFGWTNSVFEVFCQKYIDD